MTNEEPDKLELYAAIYERVVEAFPGHEVELFDNNGKIGINITIPARTETIWLRNPEDFFDAADVKNPAQWVELNIRACLDPEQRGNLIP